MAIHIRNIEDDNGDIIEYLFYCDKFCYNSDTNKEMLSGGAWPCLETSSDEYCNWCHKQVTTGIDND